MSVAAGRWDVVVVCHAPYASYLEFILPAWEAEHKQARGARILVLDEAAGEMQLSPKLIQKWVVLRGRWGHPSPARNAALPFCHTDWIMYWDGDNQVPEGAGLVIRDTVLTADPAVGYYGFAIRRQKNSTVAHPGSDHYGFWCGVDTNSLWRKTAVVLSGGWQQTELEDVDLGMRMQASGWRFGRLPLKIRRRMHPEQRDRQLSREEQRWRARTLAVVTLQRTRAMFDVWSQSFQAQQFPPAHLCSLIVGCDPAEGQGDLADYVASRLPELTRGWWSATIVRFAHDSPAICEDISARALNIKYGRSTANMLDCLEAVPKATQLLLTWDDDTIPDSHEALRKLSDELALRGDRVAVVGGWYECRVHRGKCVLSSDPERWVADISVEQAKSFSGPYKVGMIGNGFSLWRWPVLRDADACERPPVSHSVGWDMGACLRINKMGQKVLVHMDVFCKHLFDNEKS